MQSEFIRPNVGPPSIDTDIFLELWNQAVSYLPWLVYFGEGFWRVIFVISICIALFFLVATIYCVEQLKIIRKKEKEKFDERKVVPAFEEGVSQKGDQVLRDKWAKVTASLNSTNQNDWKQAILIADTMLLDILTGLGYQGEGVGEKLKRVQPGEFKNIDDAWEAHKIRNRIAHESGFVLDHRIAVQVVHRYRRVFEEFYYI